MPELIKPIATVDTAANHFSAGPSQPGRAKSVVYQNTGATARIVTIRYAVDVTGVMLVEVGAADPPTSDIALHGGVAGVSYAITFVVPPGYYYRANENAAIVTIGEWTEFQL